MLLFRLNQLQANPCLASKTVRQVQLPRTRLLLQLQVKPWHLLLLRPLPSHHFALGLPQPMQNSLKNQTTFQAQACTSYRPYPGRNFSSSCDDLVYFLVYHFVRKTPFTGAKLYRSINHNAMYYNRHKTWSIFENWATCDIRDHRWWTLDACFVKMQEITKRASKSINTWSWTKISSKETINDLCEQKPKYERLSSEVTAFVEDYSTHSSVQSLSSCLDIVVSQWKSTWNVTHLYLEK